MLCVSFVFYVSFWFHISLIYGVSAFCACVLDLLFHPVCVIIFAAIIFLKDKLSGTFVVRDSNSFPGAFGLALKVQQVPANIMPKGGRCLSVLPRLWFSFKPASNVHICCLKLPP